MTRVDSIASARKALGVGLRRRDKDGRERVHAILDTHAHAGQAEAAGIAIVDVELVKPAAPKRGEQGRLWE